MIKKKSEEIGENGSVEDLIPILYTREQLLSSERYRNQHDLVAALLEDGINYTLEQVDAKITDFKKGKVR